MQVSIVILAFVAAAVLAVSGTYCEFLRTERRQNCTRVKTVQKLLKSAIMALVAATIGF